MPRATFRFYEELNDLLPPDRRKQDFTHRFPADASIKHVIEALGVPHTEVEIVLVDGESVDFARRIGDGARVSVYPRFESLDVKPLLRLRPEPLRTPAFLVDRHLGGLGRLLRLLGFDTAFTAGRSADGIARDAVAERRIVLTRSRALLMRRELTHGCFVRASRPRAQAREIVERLQLGRLARPFTRCLVCNRSLEEAREKDVTRAVPERVRAGLREFRRCPGCERVYWKGSHYRRMEGVIERILGPDPPSE
jgi:uncharacterized protein with PIN domain